jgi:hypothetical protein
MSQWACFIAWAGLCGLYGTNILLRSTINPFQSYYCNRTADKIEVLKELAQSDSIMQSVLTWNR